MILALEDYKDSVGRYPTTLKELEDSSWSENYSYKPDSSMLGFDADYWNASNYRMIYQRDGTWYELSD